MLRTGDRFTCTASGANGDWILKLPDYFYADVPRNEYTMMRFASSLGINVPEVQLVHRDQIDDLPAQVWPGKEEWAFAVRRFDRVGPERERVHIEDLAQVRGVYPIQKYEGNYETVAGLLYRGHDSEALREFVRRITLNVLIGNGDAHLKNWSLIYLDRRIPTVSPAYDIVSTQHYRPSGEAEDLGLKLAGSRTFSSVRAYQFDRLADRLRAPAELSEVCAHTIRLANDKWPEFRDELADQPALRSSIDESLLERSTTLLRGNRH
jgi:serine/threonine-protein kinase HipA